MRLRSAVVFACLVPLLPRTVRAAQYEVFVRVETEEDLYDLLLTNQISEHSFDALLLLYQTRVDLNRAPRDRLYLLPNLDYAEVDRILAYRAEVGAIEALEDLVAAEILAPGLVDALHVFVIVRPPAAPRRQTDGFVRLEGAWTGREDRLPPAAALQARVETLRNLDLGMAATLTRNGLRRVRWDPNRHALSAASESVRFELPKLYIEWNDANWGIVAGTYRIGFGQRLTFDVTDQITPNGFFGDYELRRGGALVLRCRRAQGELQEPFCPDERVARVTPDFAWTNRLSGVAVGLKHFAVGQGWLQSYLWASYQVHRIPQIELFDAGTCADPRLDDRPECRAPPVYVRNRDPNAPAAIATFATLPAMYAEALAGIHASYFWNERSHLGLTAYASAPRWLVHGAELSFQEFSRKPFGGPFGALGMDASFGFGTQDLSVELARSFDAQPGIGGGYAAIVRSVTTLPRTELDLSARYYGPHYANPYARPVSAPDELDGLRARDEAGVRARVTARLGRSIGLRMLADAWRRISLRAFGALLFARADLKLASSWSLSLWAEYRNTIASRFTVATQLIYERSRRLTLSAQFLHRWVGTRSSPERLQEDIAVVFNITTRPADFLRLRLRLRYDFEDVWNNHRLPQVLWSYVEAGLTVRERDLVRLRYEIRAYLDNRQSTSVREPNPEHWLWIEYVFRY